MKKTNIEILNDYISKLDELNNNNVNNIGYNYFRSYVHNIKIKDNKNSENQKDITTGIVYATLCKNIIELQNMIIMSYINFKYLERYMKANNIKSCKISDDITLELNNFDKNEFVRDCYKLIETITIDPIKLKTTIDNIIESSKNKKDIDESTTDNKSNG